MPHASRLGALLSELWIRVGLVCDSWLLIAWGVELILARPKSHGEVALLKGLVGRKCPCRLECRYIRPEIRFKGYIACQRIGVNHKPLTGGITNCFLVQNHILFMLEIPRIPQECVTTICCGLGQNSLLQFDGEGVQTFLVFLDL